MLYMNKPTSVKIEKDTETKKKYKATFYDKDDNKVKTTRFGADGYSDYTQHKDKNRKERYIERHKKNENWSDPTTAGALSRYILWNKPTITESKKDFKKKFNLK
jgi:hypothetical protein